ncbi:MAG: ATP-binding cassette domain-containing protein [Methanosarcinales archaeon]|uniref:ATP-binding cassette domain-containing protein n=1 Tax=Candidatus Ethanoperedens thermophilum TaxID=2766897 RepID=A0A848DAQ0_9EURY|nr:ATP-binding cassette domain-containing protein [Candidatus Ethanoperedens thermophilum]
MALNGISFEVKEGEIFGYLGPNGTGKTILYWRKS